MATCASGDIRIGISGWRYAGWRGVFYPQGLAQRRELEYVAARFATVELNGSFYSLQRPAAFAEWYAQTPPGFVFAVKGSRFITHILRLRNAERALANFLASGLFNLREKLGPLLWQLPAQLRYREEIFDRFFELLPHDTEAAQRLARRRDARMKGRARLAAGEPRALRHAVEIRHPSFACESFVRLLRKHHVAAVFADTAGKWPYFEDLTADFVYLRLHGDVRLYTSGYTDAALERWAQRIRAWSRGEQAVDAMTVTKNAVPRRPRDVYCYFDNDVKVRAPYDARTLAQKLGLAEDLPPLELLREPQGGLAAGLGPRARKYAPVLRRLQAARAAPAVRKRSRA